MRPTSKARCCVFPLVEDVEDVFSRKGNQQALRVALHVAFEAAQHRLHRSTRLAPRVLKKGRVLVDHDAEALPLIRLAAKALCDTPDASPFARSTLAESTRPLHRPQRTARVERVLFERIHQGPECDA